MVQEIHVEGFEAYSKAVEENKGKQLFAHFSGSKDANGASWCPDCVKADPVIAKSLKFAPEESVLIHCGVGDRIFWKDQKNFFREDSNLRLKSVPTLLKPSAPRERLEEAQCADDNLVEMFFTED